MTDVPVDLIQWIAGGGVSLALGVALWGVIAGKWITRHHYDEMVKEKQAQIDELKERCDKAEIECDQWIRHALGLVHITGTAVEHAAKVHGGKVGG